MLIWREREHEDVDFAAIKHPPTFAALKACGLFKFWAISGMRSQVDLLQWLVERWNTQDQCFVIGGHRLKIELEDIYFLTGLPKRGERLSLIKSRLNHQSLASFRSEFCNDQTNDKGIDIKTIDHLELKVIAFTVTRLCGSAALHVATGSQMQMAVDCYRGTIFNWCEAVLENVKDQLTRARNGRLKNFGYGFIVVSFVLERVPMLVPPQFSVEAGHPRQPRIMRWVALMPRHPERDSEVVRFPLGHFDSLSNQHFVIQDFPYAGMDYRDDRIMILPPGEQWDDSDVGPQCPAAL